MPKSCFSLVGYTCKLLAVAAGLRTLALDFAESFESNRCTCLHARRLTVERYLSVRVCGGIVDAVHTKILRAVRAAGLPFQTMFEWNMRANRRNTIRCRIIGELGILLQALENAKHNLRSLPTDIIPTSCKASRCSFSFAVG